MWHDKHITRREFVVGKKVLIFNSRVRLFLGKIRSRWPGLFEVTKVYGALEIHSTKKGTFKVNGQRLKPYVKENIDNQNVSFLFNKLG